MLVITSLKITYTVSIFRLSVKSPGSGIQAFRGSGVQGFRCSGVQVFRGDKGFSVLDFAGPEHLNT
jgi:hypothetical protein